MVQCISSKIVGCVQTILGLLCCYHNLIQCKRTLVKDEIQTGDILFDLYCDGCRDIAQTRGGDDVLSFLDLVEGVASLVVCNCPEIVISYGQDCTSYRLSGSGLRHRTVNGSRLCSYTDNCRHQDKCQYQPFYYHFSIMTSPWSFATASFHLSV